jgi:hypothetical protein
LRGIVYLDGLGDLVDVVPPISRLFVDHRVKLCLPPQQLASYLIVVTTLERCVSEQRLATWSMSPLQQLRWLRLIVDEGHELGRNCTPVKPPKTAKQSEPTVIFTETGIGNGSGSGIDIPSPARTSVRDCPVPTDGELMLNSLSLATTFISSIAAERRWIMSGTPTTGAHSEEGLQQLFRLLVFLQHPKYTLKFPTIAESEASWNKWIVKPCVQQDEDSWEEVLTLLRQIMVRHTKVTTSFCDCVSVVVSMVCNSADIIDNSWTSNYSTPSFATSISFRGLMTWMMPLQTPSWMPNNVESSTTTERKPNTSPRPSLKLHWHSEKP